MTHTFWQMLLNVKASKDLVASIKQGKEDAAAHAVKMNTLTDQIKSHQAISSPSICCMALAVVAEVPVKASRLRHW